MLIDTQKMIADLQPQLAEITQRVAALEPDSFVTIEFQTPAVSHHGEVPLAVLREVIDAVSRSGVTFAVMLCGHRSVQMGETVMTSMRIHRAPNPTEEDYR